MKADEIRGDMKTKGNFVSAVSYEDNLGINYIIQTETNLLTPKSAVEAAEKYELINVNGRVDTIRNIEANYRIKGLFVYHYVQNNDSVKLLWKNLDNMKDCSYENLTAEYLTKPLITDKDNNGLAEVWLVYQLGCRENKEIGLGMKLVMYQGDKSYTIRGIRQTKAEKSQEDSKDLVKADDSFKELSQTIRDYAMELWNSYKIEP